MVGNGKAGDVSIVGSGKVGCEGCAERRCGGGGHDRNTGGLDGEVGGFVDGDGDR